MISIKSMDTLSSLSIYCGKLRGVMNLESCIITCSDGKVRVRGCGRGRGHVCERGLVHVHGPHEQLCGGVHASHERPCALSACMRPNERVRTSVCIRAHPSACTRTSTASERAHRNERVHPSAEGLHPPPSTTGVHPHRVRKARRAVCLQEVEAEHQGGGDAPQPDDRGMDVHARAGRPRSQEGAVRPSSRGPPSVLCIILFKVGG